MKYKSIEWYEARLEEYKNLQALVFTFREKIRNLNSNVEFYTFTGNLPGEFDKHFNITIDKHGTTG